MNIRAQFPTARSELLAMFCAYALVALLAAMVMFPRQVAAFLIGA